MENVKIDYSIMQSNYEIWQLAHTYNNLKAKKDSIENEMEDVKTKIRIQMKNALKCIDINGEEMIWRCFKSRKFLDQKSIESEQPEIYNKYLKKTDYEELRIRKEI